MALVASATSHPLAGLPSQSAKPALHVPSVQAPAPQVAVAFAKVHARPHAPQCVALVASATSHPLAGLPSQSPYGATQLDTAHAPAVHAGAALGSSQRIPQAPQWDVLTAVSTHASAQHVWPLGHLRVALQPGTHALPTQSVPEGQ